MLGQRYWANVILPTLGQLKMLWGYGLWVCVWLLKSKERKGWYSKTLCCFKSPAFIWDPEFIRRFTVVDNRLIDYQTTVKLPIRLIVAALF